MTAAVTFEHVSIAFDANIVLRDVSFSVAAGHMQVLLGASGSGKSVVLKLILGLLKPDSGVITIDGRRVDTLTEAEWTRVRSDVGMLFQEGALFDSLTVAENVGYRLYEETEVPENDVRRRVEEVLGFVGLSAHADKLPSELSGGQRRRVGIARAIAARPRLVLLDEPTSGLDPITARTIDREIIKLRDLEQVTAIVATHQLRDVFYLATHMAVTKGGEAAVVPAAPGDATHADFLMLKDGAIHFAGDAGDLLTSTDPYVMKFLSGLELPAEEAALASRAS